jgi:hypothetical protein
MSSMNAPSPRLKFELLPGDAASDRGLVGEITHLVNRVYAVAERGLWVEGATRMTTSEMAEAIAAWEVALAWRDGQIVGSVRVQQLDPRRGEFGMLVSDPAHRAEGGVPPRLVHACPSCNSSSWCIGYRPTRSTTIDGHPRLAPLLATPCDLVVYDKDLICHERTPAGR